MKEESLTIRNGLVKKLRRIYGLGHDIRSNLNGQSFTTCTISKVNMSTNPRISQRLRFLRHHSLDHTLANNLEVINGILSELGLSSDFIIAATQEKTGYSINTIDLVAFVAQLLCCSHTHELVSEHSVKGNIILDKAFSAVKKSMVRAKGNKSSKLHRLLIDKCAEAGISYKTIYLPSPT